MGLFVSGVVMSEPSPYVSIYIPRTQAEEVLALIKQQPQKKWRPVIANFLRELRRNAHGKTYEDR